MYSVNISVIFYNYIIWNIPFY